jgi:hypothetical protein
MRKPKLLSPPVRLFWNSKSHRGPDVRRLQLEKGRPPTGSNSMKSRFYLNEKGLPVYSLKTNAAVP